MRPGAELLCADDAHVVRAELGAAAALGGITTRTWSAAHGLLDPERVAAHAPPGRRPHLVSTAAVAVENTHNFGGGAVVGVGEIERLRELTRPAGIALHLDGARLWNAHVATGVALATYGRLFDTVSVCLSKGLGAPVGSLLAASAERIAEARVWRKRLGGGMRQVGILAAAGLHALDHHLERLADDHERARRLAETVADAAPGAVDPAASRPTSSSCRPHDAPAVVARAKAEGVLLSLLDPTAPARGHPPRRRRRRGWHRRRGAGPATGRLRGPKPTPGRTHQTLRLSVVSPATGRAHRGLRRPDGRRS